MTALTYDRTIKSSVLRFDELEIVAFFDELEDLVDDARKKYVAESTAAHPHMPASFHEDRVKTSWVISLRSGERLVGDGRWRDITEAISYSDIRSLDARIGGTSDSRIKVSMFDRGSAPEVELTSTDRKWLQRSHSVVRDALRKRTPKWAWIRNANVAVILFGLAGISWLVILFLNGLEVQVPVWLLISFLVIVVAVWIVLMGSLTSRVRIGVDRRGRERVFGVIKWLASTVVGAFLVYFLFRLIGLDDGQ